MKSIVRSSLTVTGLNVAGLGLGFLSSIVVAAAFGAGRDMDIYLAATTLPLFIATIISSALSFTFIPIFAEYRAGDPQEVWKVVSSVLNLSALVTGALCVVGMLAAGPLMRILAPGFSAEALVPAARMLRWIFPIIVFETVNGMMASVYYSNNQFLIPSLNKIISPLTTITYVLLFHRSVSTESLALAMVSASFIQSTALTVGFLRNGEFHYSFTFDRAHAGVRKVRNLMIPLMLGMLVYRALPMFNRFILSSLPVGSISFLSYSDKIVSLFPAILTTGISTALFPRMAEYFHSGDLKQFKTRLDEVLKVFAVTTVPIMCLVHFYGADLVRLIFQRGSFAPESTQQVASILALHIMILLPVTAGTVLGQCLYVAQRTRLAATLGVIESVLYMLICIPLAARWGLKGMVVGIVLDWFISLSVTGGAVSRVVGWSPSVVMRYTFKIVSIGFILSQVQWALHQFGLPSVLSAAAFALGYWVSLRSFHLDGELRRIWSATIGGFLERRVLSFLT